MSNELTFVEVTEDARTYAGNFFRGERRKVSGEVAGLLIGNGWAVKSSPIDVPESEAKPEGVTLEVQNAGLGVSAEDAG